MPNRMITIHVGTNTFQDPVNVSLQETPKDVLQRLNIMPKQAIVTLDSIVLDTQGMNSTLESLGATEGAILLSVVKATNAR